ncbi:unnamed protein product, partial [Ectocarpus fasciculatus]
LCGPHGSLLVDSCWCNPGYSGEVCAEYSGILRKEQCSLDPVNDLCMNTPGGYGRLRVFSEQRSNLSAQCELSYWEHTKIPVRNNVQIRAFNNFRKLPKHLGQVLELGSGPYSKLRVILEAGAMQRTVDLATFVDPHIVSYLALPHVSFPGGKLCLPRSKAFAGGCIEILLGNFGAERAVYAPHSYDTVIMVNTIEHCSDAVAVMHNIYTALKPGGYLVFAEEYAVEDQLQVTDQCHPLRITKLFYDYYF